MVSGLMLYDPMRNLSAVQEEFDRLMRNWLERSSQSPIAGAWSPPLDVEETDEAYIVHVELPGIAAEDVEVSLEDNVLSISGERRFYQEREAEGFRRLERCFGRFHRALRLPESVDPDQVEANYANGLLTVTVAKSEHAQPRRITITRRAKTRPA